MIHHLQIIGEAARQVSDSVRSSHPEVPWPKIIAMRNIIVHDYLGVDVEEVWAVVEHHLPDLRISIEGILAQMPE